MARQVASRVQTDHELNSQKNGGEHVPCSRTWQLEAVGLRTRPNRKPNHVFLFMGAERCVHTTQRGNSRRQGLQRGGWEEDEGWKTRGLQRGRWEKDEDEGWKTICREPHPLPG